MGSGKSTAAQVLVDFYGFHVLSFATPLKTMVADFLWDSDPEKKGYTYWKDFVNNNRYHPLVRTAMQFLGDDVARKIHGPDVWIRRLDDAFGIDMIEPLAYPYVIDDARYQNEVDYLREKGFHVVLINRDPIERDSYVGIQMQRSCPTMTEADIDQYIKQWACHPSEARIRGLDIDEEVEYTEFKTWAEEHIGSL